MQDPTLRHTYVKVHNSFVHLVQYGHNESIIRTKASPSTSLNSSSLQDSNPNSLLAELSFLNSSGASSTTSDGSSLLAPKNKLDKLVIFVPGNPGFLGVYHDFLVGLYKTFAKQSRSANNPVILAIGHNNFDHPDSCSYRADKRICIDYGDLSFVERSKFDSLTNPHDIELQIVNKLVILKRLLKLDLKNTQLNDCKLVFVGHSIGCYVILRLLQDQTLSKLHAGSILIHPALENMAKTEKGVIIDRYFAFKLDYLMLFMAYVINKLLPSTMKLRLSNWFSPPDLVKFSSSMVLESMAQMMTPSAVTSLVEMAKSELKYVNDLDHETMIKPHVSKLKLIYTKGDHWVNDAHRLDLIEKYPDLHIQEEHTVHAFIMDPEIVTNYAIKVGIFIQEMFE